ncbi:L,D-transpeptidase family protein [Qipengyuania sp. 1NDW9]|uniref:L,D-transpeptidase family protein n=1 Tax=Qipengyuania xiapuensis TaxID=2867236 RepID=UPI001C88DA70|nr:L,D-transpeptidase family protein [Qipengyuania xiapuensis]MBX7491991.1 L,D-transpeptidase family protein [Qipengyuania xiapuensis]
MRSTALALAIALACTPLTALAQGAKVTSPVELAQRASELKPGEWVWAPEISPDGPVVVYVDLTRQVADIYRNGIRIGVSTVSTGKPGHETPTGVFKILQKDRNHHSSTYNNAPMPFQQRLTWDGVALHAGGLPGYPESHGCVHLPYNFAHELFGTTSMGGTVIVQGRAGAPVKIPAAGVLSPATVEGLPQGYQPLQSTYRWEEEEGTEGPLAVVISTSDQEMVVLRNGIEVGRSRVELPGPPSATMVATLTVDAQGAAHWSLVPLPGHHKDDTHAADATALSRLRMPHGMLTRLKREMAPGTHVLITHARVSAETTAVPITVLAANE